MSIDSILERLAFPIWQAPTGSIAGPELAAAVSKAGGMGSMGLTWTNPEASRTQVLAIRAATKNPFFVNFALAFPPSALEAALEAGAPLVTFSWGNPSAFVPRVRAAGALFGVQITTVNEAQMALDLGADFLICQGVEAGGHVQARNSLSETLPQTVSVAGQTPVIAAGGISTGERIACALKSGARGVMVGTRFVASQESRAHPLYKQRLVESDGDTALTFCFDGGWVGAAHRVLPNETFREWEAAGKPEANQRPGEGEVVATSAKGEPIFRYEDTAPQIGYTGNVDAMCLYAGTGVGAIESILTAEEILRQLWHECLAASKTTNKKPH